MFSLPEPPLSLSSRLPLPLSCSSILDLARKRLRAEQQIACYLFSRVVITPGRVAARRLAAGRTLITHGPTVGRAAPRDGKSQPGRGGMSEEGRALCARQANVSFTNIYLLLNEILRCRLCVPPPGLGRILPPRSVVAGRYKVYESWSVKHFFFSFRYS